MKMVAVNQTYLETVNSSQATTLIISTTSKISDVEYVYMNMQIFMPYVIFSSLGMIFGIIGNCLIIGSILSHKDLRSNATCILILNLACADMSISGIVDSFTVLGVFVGESFFDKYMALCKFVAASCLIVCGTSLITMGFLAINRYISIFFNSHYNSIFQMRNTIMFCFLTWFAGFLVNLPNVVGLGGLVYDPKVMTCVFDRLKKVYTITFVASCIFTPCLLIAFCYARIFLHAYRIKKKIRNQSVAVSKSERKSERQVLESAKLAKCLFASFFLFAVCWMPLALIYLIDLTDYLPITPHVFASIPAHLNSALNPIFYGIFNSKMREGYKSFANIIFCSRIFKLNDMNSRINLPGISANTDQTAKMAYTTRKFSSIKPTVTIQR